MSDLKGRVEATIRDIQDFPKPGIVYKDIAPVLGDGQLFADITTHFVERYKDQNISKVVGIESRGFIFGTPIANALGVGFVPVRKPGKLPFTTIGKDYDLEYGTDRVEIHTDAVEKGERVLLVDDLLATGGTAGAAASLLQECGAEIVECAFLIALDFLDGRSKLPVDAYAIVSY